MRNRKNICPRELLLDFSLMYAEEICPSLERGRVNVLDKHLFVASMYGELVREQQDAPGVGEGYRNYVHALTFLRAVANSPERYGPDDLRNVVRRVDEYVGRIVDILLSTLSQ